MGPGEVDERVGAVQLGHPDEAGEAQPLMVRFMAAAVGKLQGADRPAEEKGYEQPHPPGPLDGAPGPMRGIGTFEHSFLGFGFTMDRPLAFPFHHCLTRGSNNPYPACLYHLLDLSRTMGALLLALALFGFWICKRKSPLLAAEMALYFIPTFVLLSMQAIMIDNEQLRVLVNGSLPLWLLAGLGASRLVRREGWKQRAAIVAAAALALGALSYGAAHADFPVDERDEVYFEGTPSKPMPEGFYKRDIRSGVALREDYLKPLVLPDYLTVQHSTRHVKQLSVSAGWLDFANADYMEMSSGYPWEPRAPP